MNIILEKVKRLPNDAGVYIMKDKDENFVVRIINRLDKDTAGLVLIAKNSLVCNYLNNNQNLIAKKYFAICDGIIKNDMVISKAIETTINQYGFNNNKRSTNNDGIGKYAKTYVHIEKHFKNFTLVSLKLENGRTHQIRVHLSSEGYPLLGDQLYGKSSELISHTALICKEISFIHPTTKKLLNFNIEFPDDFKRLMEQD